MKRIVHEKTPYASLRITAKRIGRISIAMLLFLAFLLGNLLRLQVFFAEEYREKVTNMPKISR